MKTTVYFDGLCMVCSKEIQHYKAQAGAENINFIDIFSPEFSAQRENLDPTQIHKIMHVRRPDGSLATKVDAFIEIWKVLPRYRFLARWATKPWLRPVLNLGYHGFTIIRPYLPRYKNLDCKESPFCALKDS